MNSKITAAGLKPGLRNSALLVALACATLGCATDPKTGKPSFKETFASDDPCANNARNIGIAGGALVGALIGNKVLGDNKKGTLMGAAAGSLIGGLIGHSIDSRRCEIARLSQEYGMQVLIAEIKPQPAPGDAPSSTGAVAVAAPPADGLSINVRDSNNQFASDSARVVPRAAEYFSKVGAQYAFAVQAARLAQKGTGATAAEQADVAQLKSRRILLVGHSDDTGSSSHNAELSERRALAVGELFKAAGVADAQIFYQGAGETMPAADNRDEAGRAQNRRVEIVDLTDEAAFRRYLEARTPTLAYYRPATASAPPALAGGTASAAAAAPPAKPKSVAAVKPAVKPAVNLVKSAAQATAPAASMASNSPPAATPGGAYDFGGTPSGGGGSGRSATLAIGAVPAEKGGFSLVSTANAAGANVPGSCADDRPRIAGGVKSLRDQKEVSFTKMMPGLFGSTWSDTINGHLVVVSQVAVFRDGGQPASRPEVLVYRDFKGNRDAKASFRAHGDVNTYRGEKAMLYRVFVEGPVSCLDIVFPYVYSGQAMDSQLLYAKQATLYEAGFRPQSTAR